MKIIVKKIYGLLRFVFMPVILLFRPAGMRIESIVATCTVGVVVFVIPRIVPARFGFGFEVAVMTVGTLLAYSFAVWGKEFEDALGRITNSGGMAVSEAQQPRSSKPHLMNPVKALVRVLYFTVRFICSPLLLLLQPTGIARDRLVVSFTSFIALFVFFIFAAARLSPNVGLAVLGAGALLGYLFAVWGKEFEAQ
jgi:hypothetical protein